MNRLARFFSFLSLGALFVTGPSTVRAAEGTAPAPAYKAPAYSGIRFTEDWSGLKKVGGDTGAAGDFFDPIKYIPLNDEGDIYLSLGGQARLRLEGWSNFNFGANGAGTAPFTPDDDIFLLTRFLLHADLHVTKHFRVFIQGKSALATDRDLLGARRGLDEDDLDLQNAFFDFMFPITDTEASVTIRVGRQELLFGKQRLVSPLDWANTRRTFDGVSGIIKFGDWTLTPFYTMPVPVQKYKFNDIADDSYFAGLYTTGKVPGVPAIGIDLYWLILQKDAITFNGAANVPTRTAGTTGPMTINTLGGRLFGKIGDSGFDYDVEGAYQVGSIGTGDVSAFMFATQLGYTLMDVPTSPRFFAGFDYASGDRGAGGDVNTFNQLFPLGHAYLGWIDQIGRQNIIAVSLGVTLKPIDKLKVDLVGHMFWRAETTDAAYNAGGGAFRPVGAGLSNEIGAEIDLLVTYQLDKHLTLQIGYSHFFAGSYISQTGPSKDIDFLYTTVQYTF